MGLRTVACRGAALLALLVAAGTGRSSAQAPASGSRGGDPASLIRALSADPRATVRVPSPAAFVRGGRVVPAGATVEGTLADADGPVDVYGTVHGDVVALRGDIVVHRSGTVTGNALAALGTVRLDGGTIGGEARVLDGPLGLPVAAPLSEGAATAHALKLVVSWLLMLLVVGMAVRALAASHLEQVVDSITHQFGRAFWVGLLGQLAFLPVLIVLAVALAITILGVLLIPFAVVAYVLAGIGLATLGFLAVAQIVGRVLHPGGTGARGDALRSLVLGIAALMALWAVAAAFSWNPLVGGALRLVVAVVTWVGVTTGFGAALLSRGGTRLVRPATPAPAVAAVGWQTPTPIGGVVAARRPAAPPPVHTP